MNVSHATDQTSWDSFLGMQRFRPFMQSWTMGEVYRDVGEPPLRLEVRDGDATVGICQAITVHARRGKHLAVPYGPIITKPSAIPQLVDALKEEARKQNCSFVRVTPFWPEGDTIENTKPAPLHLLAEHIWYIPLRQKDPWTDLQAYDAAVTEELILKGMRKNTRNLIRRAEKEGVTIEKSDDPLADLEHFIELHEETRKRHSFTPYSNAFFRAQVEHFSKVNGCTLYKAIYDGEIIASSVHMHMFGETSYHHGASTHKYNKIPASYLLQWTAIRDAMKRGDHVYSFWGIAPMHDEKNPVRGHPFSGVTTFKRGFGGRLLDLTHCMDIPVQKSYWLTRGFETARKWKRGF